MSKDYPLRGRDQELRDTSATATTFYGLRGLLKEAIQSLGGGEAFLRHERVEFDRAKSEEEQ